MNEKVSHFSKRGEGRKRNVSSPHYPTKQEIISILHHGISPYAGLISHTDVETMNHRSSSMKYKTTLHNWLRIQLLPNHVRFLIEVGTFLGSGMVHDYWQH